MKILLPSETKFVCSEKELEGLKTYIVLCGYDKEEEIFPYLMYKWRLYKKIRTTGVFFTYLELTSMRTMLGNKLTIIQPDRLKEIIREYISLYEDN